MAKDWSLLKNIPAELISLDQWVIWRYENVGLSNKPTKVPYSAKTGRKASSSNPETWCSASDAWKGLQTVGGEGLGFVFTRNDPYCGIDLDYDEVETQEDKVFLDGIAESMESYTEWSPSGVGKHIIIKASVPKGHHPKLVGLFSSGRYFCFTGNRCNDFPIQDRQELITSLFEYLGGSQVETFENLEFEPERQTDEELCTMAYNAANGAKFLDLYQGEWQKYHYASQSEADYALVDIIGHYSSNSDQIARIFRASELGQREKGQRDSYLLPMIKKSQDRQLPPLTFDPLELFKHRQSVLSAAPVVQELPTIIPLRALATANPPVTPQATSQAEFTDDDFTACDGRIANSPGGIIGEIAEWIAASSTKGTSIIPIAAALSIFSGIIGREYMHGSMGLNNYYVLVADPGMGKDKISQSQAILQQEVSKRIGKCIGFSGPKFASHQGINAALVEEPSFCTVLGEFGQMLSGLYNKNNPNATGMKGELLALHGQSGIGGKIQARKYAKKENNTQEVIRPALSVIGDCATDTFWKNLDEESLVDGLISRFLILEYKGPMPFDNREAHLHSMPPEALVGKLSDLCASIAALRDQNRTVFVEMDEETAILDKEYSVSCVMDHRHLENNIMRHAYARGRFKAIRIAASLAVSDNPYVPMIRKHNYLWAKRIISLEIENVKSHFDTGDVGAIAGETKQIHDFKQVIKTYLNSSEQQLEKYTNSGVTLTMQGAGCISHSYLITRCSSLASYKNAKIGASKAISAIINTMVECGEFQRITPQQATAMFGSDRQVYKIRNLNYFTKES